MEATVERLGTIPTAARSSPSFSTRMARRDILAPDGLKAGDKVISSAEADIKPGNCLPIEKIPVGTIIHNIELYPATAPSWCAAPVLRLS